MSKLAQSVEFDVLVNNAGVDRPKKFLQADAGRHRPAVDVNLRAVLHLCRLLVPGMVARDRGHVVNITSIAGAYNFGGNSTYHATKAAVSMLSQPAAHRLPSASACASPRSARAASRPTSSPTSTATRPETRRTLHRRASSCRRPTDIADAIAFAIAAPVAVNIGHMEITPTLQVPGGLSTARPAKPVPPEIATEAAR